MENGPSEAGADNEEEAGDEDNANGATAGGVKKVSPSEPASNAEAQAEEHNAEITGVRSTATDTGNTQPCTKSREV